MTNWRAKENFLKGANRLRQIFQNGYDEKYCATIEELKREAEKDELFKYVLFLLSQEYFCRSDFSINEMFDAKNDIKDGGTNTVNREIIDIKSWFKMVLAGLVIEPYPTVDYLLKKQKKPSVYGEFDEIFPATRFLNRLAESFDSNNCEKIAAAYEEVYSNLSADLRQVIDSSFILKLEAEADYAAGPSFRFELLDYIDFDNRSEFSAIPAELLTVDEGCDFGVPFGKRWARRLVARPAAHDKIFFDPMKGGEFPSPPPRSLESACMNFMVQLPESVGIDLIHENIFDNSLLSPEFLDFAAFSMHFSQFLEQIPKALKRPLKNTDIFAHAPLNQPARNGSKASLASFRALLLACGLRGHLNLNALPPVDVHEILNFDSENTSACLLLGLAASQAINASFNHLSLAQNHKFLIKLFTMHLPSYQTSLNLEIPPTLQLASTLALGLYRFRSFDRGTAQMLLREIFRKAPENVNFKAVEDSPLFSINPALALGMCLMGAKEAGGNQNHFAFADDILLQLHQPGSANQISILIATALISINSQNSTNNSTANANNRAFYSTGTASAYKLPYARNLPDLLDKPEGLVFWCHLAGRMEAWSSFDDRLSISDQGGDAIKLNFDAIFEAACNPEIDSVWTDSSLLSLFIYACQVLTANSAFLALKYAGSAKSIESLDNWLDKISALPILNNTDGDFFFVKIQMHLLSTFQYLLLCKCIINAGSGETSCWARLRGLLAAHPLLFKYGNGRLFYSAIGFLFLGKGRAVIRTQNTDGSLNHLAVASLLCSLLPILPSSPVDAEFAFAPLLDCLWPLACK